MRRFLPFFAALPLCAPAVGQIRVVNYNTLDGPTPGVHDNSANMSTIFAGIAAQSVNGIAKRPDLIILQEQTNTSAAALASLLNTQYGLSGAYVAIQPAGQPGSADPIFIDRQAFVYDSTALQLIGSGTSIATGVQRPVIRAQFRPVGYTSAAASFYAYGAHLMASDAGERASQTAAMRANSNALGEVHAIYAGDFNMQNNQETGWQNMVTGAGAGLAVDPLNPNNNSQTWNNNSAFASIHTQSTRTTPTPDNDGGASGGMDDRFDVQLSTQEFHDGEGLSYIANSYRAYGQDGQHFNDPINVAPFPLGSTIANALWDASDHLPVVVDYQLPAKMTVTQLSASPERVIVGAAAVGTFQVHNSANVAVSAGADELDYTIALSGAALAIGSLSSTSPAASAGNIHRVNLNTLTPGVTSGSAVFSANSQGSSGSTSFALSTIVLANATPSLDSTKPTQLLTIDFGIAALGSTPSTAPVSIHNFITTPGFTAGLDVDQVQSTGDTSELSLMIAAGGGTIAAGTARSGTVTFAATAVGTYHANWSIRTSDENLPGEQLYSPLLLQLVGRAALGGDADLNNTVNITDFAILAGNFNETSQTWQDGDFNRDGSVNIADFAVLAGNFNQSVPRANVPEAMFAGFFCAFAWSLKRPRRRLSCGHHES